MKPLRGISSGSTVWCRGETHRYTVLYTYINRHVGTPGKTETKHTMSVGTAQFCYIGSRIGWVSALLYYHIISHQARRFLKRQETRFSFLRIIDWVNLTTIIFHSGHQVRWTYQPGSHRRKVTQDFSSTFFLRCVP